MLTNKLTGTLALAGLIFNFGCGGDDSEDTSTTVVDTGDDDSGDDDSTVSVTVSTTVSTTDMDTTVSTTDDTEDTGPQDTGPEDTGPQDTGTESETGNDCTPQDECQNDNDCPGGGECIGCLCVGGTTTGGFPTMSDYGPCPDCAEGEMPVEVQGIEGCFCSPGCAGEGADCAMPNMGTAEAQCVLVLDGGEEPTNCALLCDPEMEGMCPEGATCEPVPMAQVGVCVHPAA